MAEHPLGGHTKKLPHTSVFAPSVRNCKSNHPKIKRNSVGLLWMKKGAPVIEASYQELQVPL